MLIVDRRKAIMQTTTSDYTGSELLLAERLPVCAPIAPLPGSHIHISTVTLRAEPVQPAHSLLIVLLCPSGRKDSKTPEKEEERGSTAKLYFCHILPFSFFGGG